MLINNAGGALQITGGPKGEFKDMPMIQFLADIEKARFIVGQVICVDCGQNTINNVFTKLRTFFRWAVEQGKTDELFPLISQHKYNVAIKKK